MKKSRLLGSVCATIFSFISVPSYAALVDNGNGLIYDTVLDITWAQPNNIGRNWDDANAWAAGLTLGGASDWRLPYISVAAGAGPFTGTPVDCNTATEEQCRDNELGYMFYHNLSGTNGNSILTSGDPDLALFPALGSNDFWSGTESSFQAAWGYTFGSGGQISYFQGFGLYSWAVHAGNVGVVSAPDITVTDSVAPIDDLQLAFGDITEMTTADQTVTVANDGSADLVLGTVAVADPLVAPFSILNDTCSGQTLAPAANCTLTVRFSPSSIGTFNDSLDIPSDDPDENPVTVSVSGNGIGVTAPDITVTDSVAPVDDLQVPFGSITEMTITDQVVTVTNGGNADLAVGNVATANPLVAPFSVVNDNCSTQTITPTASCTFTVRFEPTASGAFNDSLDIPSDDADENPVTVSVSGTGTPAPVPDITVTDSIAPVSDLQIPFADLTEGGSTDQTVTVTNDGNADLALGNIGVADSLAAPFSLLNDTCSSQTLTATASCTFMVRFAPTAAGTSNDSLDIPSDDPDENPITVNVSGTGLAAAMNNPPSGPQLVSPANGQQGLATTVTLRWQPSTDPDGDTVTYDVYNCTDSDPLNNCVPLVNVALLDQGPIGGIYYAGLGLGGGIVLLGFAFTGAPRGRKQTVLLLVFLVASSLLASCHNDNGSGNKIYEVSGLTADTTYYWAVVANDGNGGVTPSAVWSYSTQ